MEASLILDVQDLHFSYPTEPESGAPATEVLKGVDLRIHRGEFVAVL